MKIIPLGTNGFFPSFGRETACYALPLKEKLIIIDAGTGLFRLAEPIGQKLLKNYQEINLFLSHYHLDHTFGFYAAFKFFFGKKVTVFGKKKRKVFQELTSIKYFPINYEEKHQNFIWKELERGENLVLDYKVFVREQFHRGEGSLAFRFYFPSEKKDFAYVTDSEPTKESIEFVKGVNLLFHEWEPVARTWQRRPLEGQIHNGHVTTFGAALIAQAGKVGKLFLIHHFPFFDEKKLERQLKLARLIFPKTYLAWDLTPIEF